MGILGKRLFIHYIFFTHPPLFASNKGMVFMQGLAYFQFVKFCPLDTSCMEKKDIRLMTDTLFSGAEEILPRVPMLNIMSKNIHHENYARVLRIFKRAAVRKSTRSILKASQITRDGKSTSKVVRSLKRPQTSRHTAIQKLKGTRVCQG